MRTGSFFDRLARLRTGLGAGIYPYYADAVAGSESLLNLGSGDGVLSEYLRRTVDGIEVIDVDVVDANRVGKPPVVYDGRNIPLADRSVDIVLCEFVLHHTQIHEQLVGEMKRVCRGRIIVVEDCADKPIDRMLCSIHGLVTRPMSMGGRAQFRSRSEWLRLFRNCGLGEIRVIEIPRRHNISYPVARSVFFLSPTNTGRQEA